MLNIGKLTPGAAEYYVGEVATSAEDYYTGEGEAKGRWVGSLRSTLELEGEVDPEHFRRVLLGQHPHTGEYLISAAGSAGRASQRRPSTPLEQSGDAPVDVVRAATALGVSTRYVRQLLDAGARYQDALDKAAPDDQVVEPRSYLIGKQVTNHGNGGPDVWEVSRAEVDRHAATSEPRKPRPGYDVTLRPPKSVSVVWALADSATRATVRQAHTEAVDEVVRYLESRAIKGRVTVYKAQRELETDGLIAAAFDHRTSRAGDPLLHTHVVVANLTLVDAGDKDGPVWRAIAARGLFEHAKSAGHLYQAHLRHLMSQRLGVEWGEVTNGYADISGVPERVIEAFSKRRTEIEEVMAESGNTSARAAQIATLETRKPKDYLVDPDTLFDQWRSEAAALGFGAAHVAACMGKQRPAALTPAELQAAFNDLAEPTGLTERASTFRRTDVVEALASRFGASCTALEIEAHADAFLTGDTVAVVDRTRRAAPTPGPAAPATAPSQVSTQPKPPTSMQAIYTTTELAALEEELLTWADTSQRRTGAVDGAVVGAVLDARPELSGEQVVMVEALCRRADAILPIAGRPGAGKTYATEAAVAAHLAAGVAIVGAAVSAAAASELESAAGFGRSVMPATTVAKLLRDLDQWGGLAPDSTVIVDEASMLSTRDLHLLASHARNANATIVLIGDPDQHGPVDVGGVFQRLCRDRGDDLIRLVENNRQTDQVERLAIGEYRDGHIADALARMDVAGRIVRSATAGESFDAMVADWYADRLDGRADPMIAGPNSTRRALNDRARVLLKANGELTGKPLVVAGREYLVGDQVVARRNDRRLRNAAGGEFVKNGSAGTVTNLHPKSGEVTVAFEREGTIRVPRTYLAAGRLEHGYARTSYGVQGATHGTARYHPTDQSSFEEGYVAITRGRDQSRLYIVDGTITHHDDETHQRPDPIRFDLGDIADALTRRRTGTMVADTAGRLTTVHRLAETMTLRALTDERTRLEQVLAKAPRSATEAIDAATAELETLQTRRNAWALGEGSERKIAALDRAIGRTDVALTAARERQQDRERWFDEHAEVVDRYDIVRRAESHRRTKIAANPEHYLVGADAGPAPVLQRDRRTRHERLVAEAVAWDMAAPVDTTAEAEYVMELQ
ncbi:MAG: MobF family relaxase [Acidimicrobiales bacterium]